MCRRPMLGGTVHSEDAKGLWQGLHGQPVGAEVQTDFWLFSDTSCLPPRSMSSCSRSDLTALCGNLVTLGAPGGIWLVRDGTWPL